MWGGEKRRVVGGSWVRAMGAGVRGRGVSFSPHYSAFTGSGQNPRRNLSANEFLLVGEAAPP